MQKSPVAMVYNEPVNPEGSYSEASRDILDQVRAVEESLATLGVPSIRIPFTRDLPSFVDKILEKGIQHAFNLCESVDENPHLIGHPAAVMDILGISYTGSPAMALAITTDKLYTKRLLRAQGIPTPKFEAYDNTSLPKLKGFRFPVIVKPRFEDGSIGIDQESVVTEKKQLRKILPEFHDRFGPLILEEFVSGREFNVSLFGYPSPHVLPIAEMSFDSFPRELHPIVGYRAKWDRESFEYHHTPRVFPTDLPEFLERKIRRTAMDCFRHFKLRDYGRVDFRVNQSGVAYVLEINANPCISPDAGFPAALAQAGINYNRFMGQLLEFVRKRKAKRDSPCPYRSRKRLDSNHSISTMKEENRERYMQRSVKYRILRRSSLIEKRKIRRPFTPRGRQGESEIRFKTLQRTDREKIREVLEDVKSFTPEEISVAISLVDETLGGSTAYRFLVATDERDTVLGYICYGQTPMTSGTWDIYWIAVSRRFQKRHVGNMLLRAAEDEICAEGGRLIIIETSTKPSYRSTRRFYEKMGYRVTARIAKFYSERDDKLVYSKYFPC